MPMKPIPDAFAAGQSEDRCCFTCFTLINPDPVPTGQKCLVSGFYYLAYICPPWVNPPDPPKDEVMNGELLITANNGLQYPIQQFDMHKEIGMHVYGHYWIMPYQLKNATKINSEIIISTEHCGISVPHNFDANIVP